MKVYELAKELEVQSKDLIEFAESLGMDIKSHMSNIEDADADILREQMQVPVGVAADFGETVVEQPQNSAEAKSWKPDLSRMIKIKNISNGYLIYKSKRQLGYTVEWPNPGDTNYLELEEFLNLKNTDRRFITEPWIRIIEDDEIEILKYANIYKFYEGLFGIDSIRKLLQENFNSFKSKFDALPKGFKSTVAEYAAQMIASGELDSIKVKEYIEKEMNLELDRG